MVITNLCVAVDFACSAKWYCKDDVEKKEADMRRKKILQDMHEKNEDSTGHEKKEDNRT